MKKFVKFVLAGILINVPPEIVNQIYVHNTVVGFFRTAIIYVLFLGILFFLKKIFNRLVRNKMANAVSWYVILGLFGLYVEWNLLGNNGAAWYGQIAMFTFWGSFALMPSIFVEDPLFPKLKQAIIYYSIPWIILYVIAGLANPGLGLLIWILGCIWLNYFYFRYFRLLSV